jgi:8-oxo-dGTP pyrophosphatase MutT (NUDIX family)
VPEGGQGLPEDWRERLRQRLLAQPDHELEHCYFVTARLDELAAPLRSQLCTELPGQLKAAAVLVPIVERESAPTLLLTVRASHLRRHAGQISFPGGRMEDADADPIAAAVRETYEELAIEPRFVAPMGFLSDHIVRTGYRITPVVALVQPGFTLAPDSAEVAEVFELPLAFALAEDNYRSLQRTLREMTLSVWELSYGERTIWGATAGILAHLRELLSHE